MDGATPKERRAAQVAHVLARAVRDGEVEAIDALRILKHELRRLNTNRSHKLETRSDGATLSIKKYAPERPPRNDSDDALHADHVYAFTADLLYGITDPETWIEELRRLATVVCVTAKENYALEQVEKSGLHGPGKYQVAGVTFSTPVPWDPLPGDDADSQPQRTSEWIPHRVSDSADYLEREPPVYDRDDESRPIRLRPVAERDALLNDLIETTGYVDEGELHEPGAARLPAEGTGPEPS